MCVLLLLFSPHNPGWNHNLGDALILELISHSSPRYANRPVRKKTAKHAVLASACELQIRETPSFEASENPKKNHQQHPKTNKHTKKTQISHIVPILSLP